MFIIRLKPKFVKDKIKMIRNINVLTFATRITNNALTIVIDCRLKSSPNLNRLKIMIISRMQIDEITVEIAT